VNWRFVSFLWRDERPGLLSVRANGKQQSGRDGRMSPRSE
jgi:hypothetical protein